MTPQTEIAKPKEDVPVAQQLQKLPGMHSPKVAAWIASQQIPADGWYVASPNLTVAETRKLEKVGAAVEELLDKIG